MCCVGGGGGLWTFRALLPDPPLKLSKFFIKSETFASKS